MLVAATATFGLVGCASVDDAADDDLRAAWDKVKAEFGRVTGDL